MAAGCVWKSGCAGVVGHMALSLSRPLKNGRDTLGSEGTEDEGEQEDLLTAALAEGEHCASACFCCFFSTRICVMLTWRPSDLFVKTGTGLAFSVAGWVLLRDEWLEETDEENNGREVKGDGTWHISVPWQWENCKMGLGIWGFSCPLVVAGCLMLIGPAGCLRGHGADANRERGTLSGGKTLGSWVSTSLLKLLEVRLAGKAPTFWKSR